MATTYDPKVIEPKWQARWAKERAFEATDDFTKPKFYGLVEFPKGYNYACMVNPDACIGCASCGIVCPDGCISVYKVKIEN